ncbi:MAG: hypothetical protein H7831_05060 [Magnetococcus sp. WYHC-3]
MWTPETARRGMRVGTGTLLGLASVLALSACGGGGGDSSSTTTLSGQFVDAPVVGLNYVAGNISGQTDATGNFTYENGTNITFRIGNITLGTARAKALMTPMDLVANGTARDIPVVNMVRLLQSLDVTPANTSEITLTNATHAAAANISLTFSDNYTAFASQVLQRLNVTLVDLTTAQDTFESHLTSAGISLTNGVATNLTDSRAVDSFLAGATAFYDLDRDYLLDDGEPYTYTRTQQNANPPAKPVGWFSLTTPLSDPNAPIVVIGGVDVATGQNFTGMMTAPAGSNYATPLTSMMESLMRSDANLTRAQAEAVVRNATGLDSTVNLTATNPLAEPQLMRRVTLFGRLAEEATEAVAGLSPSSVDANQTVSINETARRALYHSSLRASALSVRERADSLANGTVTEPFVSNTTSANSTNGTAALNNLTQGTLGRLIGSIKSVQSGGNTTGAEVLLPGGLLGDIASNSTNITQVQTLVAPAVTQRLVSSSVLYENNTAIPVGNETAALSYYSQDNGINTRLSQESNFNVTSVVSTLRQGGLLGDSASNASSNATFNSTLQTLSNSIANFITIGGASDAVSEAGPALNNLQGALLNTTAAIPPGFNATISGVNQTQLNTLGNLTNTTIATQPRNPMEALIESLLVMPVYNTTSKAAVSTALDTLRDFAMLYNPANDTVVLQGTQVSGAFPGNALSLTWDSSYQSYGATTGVHGYAVKLNLDGFRLLSVTSDNGTTNQIYALANASEICAFRFNDNTSLSQTTGRLSGSSSLLGDIDLMNSAALSCP